MATTVRSHAKINLGLGIGAPRPDGFHSLITVYQTLELHDVVTVTARPASDTSIRLTSNDQRVPMDERNTAWKMVALALRTLDKAAEVDIHIDKRLPVQGGLGAGSANAAAALVGLEAELGRAERHLRSLPKKELPRDSRGADRLGWWSSYRLEIAAMVGSDVPLFLIGGAVLGKDHGQEVYPLPDIKPAIWCVVATPNVGVSTPQAFRDWDAHLANQGLTAEAGLTADAINPRMKLLSSVYASVFAGRIPRGAEGAGSSGVLSGGEDLAGPNESALVRTGISRWLWNDFEQVVFPQHPSLAEIKRTLAATGTPEAAVHASLSGSGSALYGLYKTRGDAQAARERLTAAGVESQITRTLPRSEYWANMLVQQ
jgi:4-diphosphocytidyl-2-C-methyl-D-erythritol kinase